MLGVNHLFKPSQDTESQSNEQSALPVLHFSPLFQVVMKQFYCKEMLEMICNYGRYNTKYFNISGSRWRFSLHRTAQYYQDWGEEREGGGRISHNGSNGSKT